MKLPHRRQFLHLAAGAASLSVVAHTARAQSYPTRPVRIIVPAPAGGGIDVLARLMGQWLSERLGRPFIIEAQAPISVPRPSFVPPLTVIRSS
jgi:tripartite-type tricarboxylate transporter receptor subunit TctC